MRSVPHILIIGGSGLIGGSIAARLITDGHRVTVVARRVAAMEGPRLSSVALDLADMCTPSQWTSHLNGIDAVIYCAGVLQDSPQDSTEVVHARAAAALFEACETHGVRRVLHFSAVGVDRHELTKFSTTKHAGDAALMKLNLDWVILRPSIVLGPRAYGASALMRGLAALSVYPALPETNPLQPIHIDDVVETVRFFLQENAPSRLAVELVGPKHMSFDAVVAMFREWLGWRPARVFTVPSWAAGFLYRLGDMAAWFGWRPPVRTTARREMTRGALGNADAVPKATGIVPRDVASAFAAEPASVQERWFARLYLLKPAIFTVFPAFWITTGLVSIGPGRERGIELVMEGGTSHAVALLATLSGGLADIVIGTLIAFRRSARLGLYAAFVISIAYAIIGSILVPRLWLDPLGPMLKIAPVMVFNLVALSILEDR